jgi:hypothetical protein
MLFHAVENYPVGIKISSGYNNVKQWSAEGAFDTATKAVKEEDTDAMKLAKR